MVQTCDHIGIFTQNIESMKEFYTGALGFSLGNESTLSKSVMDKIFGFGHECHFVKLHRDGFMVELFAPVSTELHTPAAGTAGLNHWGYCVADRASCVDELRQKGHTIVEIERNGRSAYFVLDPDGNRIEIRDYPR
jgi:catechol 2,3-dioxygenase-like lactoylglutathione lyase family enzyme